MRLIDADALIKKLGNEIDPDNTNYAVIRTIHEYCCDRLADAPTFEQNQAEFRWHDLRKDPKDLPAKDGLYLTYSHFYFQPTPDPDVIGEDEDYTLTHFIDGKWEPWEGYYQTIAWREIEPFEEVNQDEFRRNL